jgi:hypothetical protein
MEAKETSTPGSGYHMKFLGKSNLINLRVSLFFLWFDENEPLHFKSQKHFYYRLLIETSQYITFLNLALNMDVSGYVRLLPLE